MSRRWRSRVSTMCGIPFENIRISWTHTHSGPTVTKSTWVQGGVDMIEPYTAALVDRIAGVVWEAKRQTRPVHLRSITGECDVNVNRRLTLPDGRIVVGQNPEGYVDPSLFVLRFDAEEGPPIIVVGYACHPTIMAHRNRLITPDYPGVVKRVVESSLGGHCLFLQGAAGNICSIEDLTSNPESYRRIGSVIGHEAARLAWSSITPPQKMQFDQVVESGAPLALFDYEPKDSTQDTPLSCIERPITLPVRRLPSVNELENQFRKETEKVEWLRREGDDDQLTQATYQAKRTSHLLRLAELTDGNDTISLPVQLVRIGDVALVSMPVELFAEIGAAIRERSPFSSTFVSGYSNGVFGYFPTKQAFHEGGYEVETSPFTAEAEERLVEGVVSLLHTL